MAFEQLSGTQRKIFRIAILSAFVDELTFDMFLNGELNKPPLRNFVGAPPFEQQVFGLIRVAQAEGWTDDLIAALSEQRARNVLIHNLPDALRMATSEAELRVVAAGLTLERIVRDAGFNDFGHG